MLWNHNCKWVCSVLLSQMNRNIPGLPTQLSWSFMSWVLIGGGGKWGGDGEMKLFFLLWCPFSSCSLKQTPGERGEAGQACWGSRGHLCVFYLLVPFPHCLSPPTPPIPTLPPKPACALRVPCSLCAENAASLRAQSLEPSTSQCDPVLLVFDAYDKEPAC